MVITIINSLKNLGKSYPNQELVRNILRCLPKCWTPKVTTIEEAKDLSNLPLKQLLGSLMTHETTMKSHERVETKKKKPVALKASKEGSESDGYGDMALITSQLKKYLKSQKGKKVFKKKFHQDEESSKTEEPTCYECKKPGHFKSECPNLKNKAQFKKKAEYSKKKKAMVATWDDSDPSSSEEECDEEVANIAFTEIQEEEEDEVNFSFDELQDAYENLFHEYKNVCLKNKSLKKNAISMSKEIENLKNENSYHKIEIDILNVSLKLSNDFEEENKKLKLEIDSLKKTFSKFSNCSDKLDNLLGLQRRVFDKAGFGYEEMNNVKHFNNFFVKKVEPKISCNYCGRLGHIPTSCFHRMNIGKTKKVWIPKGTTLTNPQGPKFIWVPKV
ncbi:zf-CCHC domain-containing protein/UBN2 domain-containing protein [Cephalotus follicularis]|uniref:Zf-CCHC domain-containing protein/UBN2 domain-containing protein n=1 Tax=Cephalotus follicularis TaxID=3775 RepID=A0A1Q3AXW8_CEPFO|nr:zf-CCHC domain-containing protein/UBN2 domain-containing protein [Cephalotus follicularis]